MRQSTERLEEQEEERKAEGESEGEGKTEGGLRRTSMRMNRVSDTTYMNLGDSVQIVYPQEEQSEEERRHGRENQVGSVSDRRHEKLLSEKDGVSRILEGH